MAISKKQKELDVMKWEKSIAMNKDACGSFDFCVKCDKNLENPCEKAFNKFNAKPATKKAETKKVAPAKKEVVAPAPAVKVENVKKPAQKVEAKPEVKAEKKANVKLAKKNR